MYAVICKNCTQKLYGGKPKKLECIKNGFENRRRIPRWAWTYTAECCKEYNCPED